VFFLANILLVGILVNRYDVSSNPALNGQRKIQTIEAVVIVGIAISEFPILNILNSLVSKGIQDSILEDSLSEPYTDGLSQPTKSPSIASPRRKMSANSSDEESDVELER